jgi:predicted RNA-binding Zn-ribbon protein involved in translation (DUF1610 family)
MNAPRPPRPPLPPRDDNDERMEFNLDDEPTQAAAAQSAEPAQGGSTGGAKRFPCESCGAELTYQPGTADLACQYCGHNNHIPQSEAEILELDYEAHLSQLAQATDTEEHATVKCESCGAEIDRPEDLTAFACVFCGGKIVTQSETHRLIKPQSLLPFKIQRREAVEAFRKWITSLWFAPNELKKYARMDTRIQGIYLPYWTYDSNTTTRYTGQRGEDYWVTVGSGKNRKRVRKTRWYPASGVVFNTFDDVLVVASNSLPRNYIEQLEPWDIRELTPYDDRYLSGFLAESYQLDLPTGFRLAQGIMQVTIQQTVKRDIGGDRQRVHSMNTAYKNVTFKHILLPVWMSAYQYRDKSYRFMINGRTGEVQGERPWSWWKIGLTILIVLMIVGLIVYLMHRAEVLDDAAVAAGSALMQ